MKMNNQLPEAADQEAQTQAQEAQPPVPPPAGPEEHAEPAEETTVSVPVHTDTVEADSATGPETGPVNTDGAQTPETGEGQEKKGKGKKRKPSKARRRVGLGLVLLGVGCMVIAAAYQLSTYPWSMIAVKYFGAEVAESLPDPSPLPYEYRFYDEAEDTGKIPETVPGERADQEVNRPVIELAVIGSVKIPFLSVSENLLEGADEQQLYGIGHVPGTAMPGEAGNCVIAGHRGYIGMHPFMYLPELRMGDKVYITVQDQVYTYEVYDSFEVEPDESWVMQPKSSEEPYMLTIITCTPIPTYTHRYICRARLVSE